MAKNISCLRCNKKMRFVKTEEIQLGKTGFFFRDLSNLVAGSLEVDIYVCPKCGKLEFFSADDIEDAEEDLPQVQCPECGKCHDFDYSKCPFCNHKYEE